MLLVSRPRLEPTIESLLAHLRWWSDPDVCGPVPCVLADEWEQLLRSMATETRSRKEDETALADEVERLREGWAALYCSRCSADSDDESRDERCPGCGAENDS